MSNDMFTYRNLNTGDEVSYPKRSVRLDALPNWVITALPDDFGRDVQESEAPSSPPLVPDFQDGTPEDGEHVPDVEAAPVATPLRNASKAEWAEYALTRGGDPARVAGMKRDELIDEFGPQE